MTILSRFLGRRALAALQFARGLGVRTLVFAAAVVGAMAPWELTHQLRFVTNPDPASETFVALKGRYARAREALWSLDRVGYIAVEPSTGPSGLPRQVEAQFWLAPVALAAPSPSGPVLIDAPNHLALQQFLESFPHREVSECGQGLAIAQPNAP